MRPLSTYFDLLLFQYNVFSALETVCAVGHISVFYLLTYFSPESVALGGLRL